MGIHLQQTATMGASLEKPSLSQKLEQQAKKDKRDKKMKRCNKIISYIESKVDGSDGKTFEEFVNESEKIYDGMIVLKSFPTSLCKEQMLADCSYINKHITLPKGMRISTTWWSGYCFALLLY